MSNREERLPTRGAFCKSCGRLPHACNCSKRDLRTLDAWDEPIPETKAAKKVEKAINDAPDARTVVAGHAVAYHETDEKRLNAAVTISSSDMIERAVSSIHALARFLLNLEDKALDLLSVGVMPRRDSSFTAIVEYEGFVMQQHAPTLSEALNLLLTDLINRVGERVARGDEIIAEVQGQ